MGRACGGAVLLFRFASWCLFIIIRLGKAPGSFCFPCLFFCQHYTQSPFNQKWLPLPASSCNMTSLSSSMSIGKPLSRVPSFEELPNVDSPPTPSQAEVELSHINVEHRAHELTHENTEIQLAYEEQRQTFETEHIHDTQPAVCTTRYTLLNTYDFC